MLIPVKHVTAWYWDSNLRGFPGPVDYNYYNKNLVYNLEAGQRIWRITYKGKRSNQALSYDNFITEVNEKGVGFKSSLDGDLFYEFVREDKDFGDLEIIPCYIFYSLQDLEDYFDGKEPHPEGRWRHNSHTRTSFPDKYSDINLKNFEKIGQMKLKF